MAAAGRGVRIVVSGRVQGVGYRYFARAQAQSLGVRGYVRNLADGSVEAVAVGPPDGVEQFVARLRDGPAAGVVRQCQVTPLEEAGTHSDFQITY
jgi:acylphosphatase